MPKSAGSSGKRLLLRIQQAACQCVHLPRELSFRNFVPSLAGSNSTHLLRNVSFDTC